jgi:hypothetical protein
VAVGGVSESLIIDVSVNDRGATNAFREVREEVKSVGKQATTAFTGMEASANKVGFAANALTSKFKALGKAAVGFIGVDLIAKVVGLDSAMSALSKTTDGLATVIRRAVLGLDAELAPAFKGMEDSAIRAKKALEDLRAEAAKERYELAPGYSVNLGRLRDSGGFFYGKGLEQTLAVQDELRKYREELLVGQEYGLMAAVNKDQADRWIEWMVSGRAAEMFRTLSAELRRYEQGAEVSAKANDKLAQSIARIAKESSKSGLPFMLSGIPALTSAGFSMAREREFRFGVAEEESERMANIDAMNAQMLAERNRRTDVPSGRTPFAVPGVVRAGVGGLTDLIGQGIAGIDTVTQKIVEATKAMQTFGAGTSDALKSLGADFERNLGSQAVHQTFDAFTGFFFDLATNIKDADEALKNLGRSLISVLANQAAQRLALSATTGLFGLLDIKPTEQANGGVWRGGINSFASGGVAYGPQLAMIGDNKSRTEAIVPMPDGRSIPVEMRGGGGTVNMTLNVASLDPRTAFEVIAPHLPKIQKAIAGALRGGSDRELTVAIRGAVS